jgi:hypothetical protein
MTEFRSLYDENGICTQCFHPSRITKDLPFPHWCDYHMLLYSERKGQMNISALEFTTQHLFHWGLEYERIHKIIHLIDIFAPLNTITSKLCTYNYMIPDDSYNSLYSYLFDQTFEKLVIILQN